jgi:murein DD-endopeptidase MepM/ murein hydrolase activator NlpD
VRRLALFLLCLTLAGIAGTANADVFQVVPTTSAPILPPPPAVPQQLSYAQLLALWQGAGAQYGVPWQVLAAINKVESNFGRNMGPSSAGAIGWMQFMPATWLEYGVDADGDGVANPWDAADAIYSAARYLAANGGATDIYGAVYQYNHADWYVQEVLGLAQVFQGSTTIAFSIDRLQQQLDAARRTVAEAGDRVLAADRVVQRWQRRADAAKLLTDQLALHKQAVLAAFRRDAAARALADARRTLAKAQQAAAAPSFDPAVGGLMGAAPAAGASGYVFPVGGGAGVVSASHTHHDYPAVDIAAPLGEPVYALASSTVLRAWQTPDPRCGIGLTLRAFDGQVWTYCHLSVLDQSVTPGTQLSAGQQIGLVGATGDATGPHLHLQLQPATVWPQSEAWFQQAAGTAFTWSDGPSAAQYAQPAPQPVRSLQFAATAPAPAPQVSNGPVFRVVPAQQTGGGVVMFTRP